MFFPRINQQNKQTIQDEKKRCCSSNEEMCNGEKGVCIRNTEQDKMHAVQTMQARRKKQRARKERSKRNGQDGD